MRYVYFAALALVLTGISVSAQAQNRSGVSIPPGYTPVWDDDRLNPHRGKGTLAGEAQMNALWTQTVPMELRPVPLATVATPVPVAQSDVYQELDGVFVQVSGFDQATSAQAAAQAMRSEGITARRGILRKGGRDTPIVLAGPYESTAQAGQAASKLRALGFGPVTVRN